MGRIISLNITMPDGQTSSRDFDADTVLIGSGPSAVLKIEDAEVSSIHAVIKAGPDGSLTISTSRQRIRSTTFSGVGLVLSGGALLVLLVWWFRTHRRAKASARADHPTAPQSE